MLSAKSTPPSARIKRWLLYLQQFCYEIKHIAGADNHTDALSRLLGPGTGCTRRKSNRPGTDSLETYCQASTRGSARNGTQERTAQRERQVARHVQARRLIIRPCNSEEREFEILL